MKCFVCDLEGNYLFCEQHAPRHGDVFLRDGKAIFSGKMPTLYALFLWLKGIYIIRWWTGTDSRTLVEFPPGDFTWHVRIVLHRIKARLTYFMIGQHWTGCKQVNSELIRFFGPKISIKMRQKTYPPLIQKPVEKIPHRHTNIIVQTHRSNKNRKYKDWVYGVDIIQELKHKLAYEMPDVNIIEVDGSEDMRQIYAIADGYVNTKRYANGNGRMMEECKINRIFFYYNESGAPDLYWIKEFIDALRLKKKATPISGALA